MPGNEGNHLSGTEAYKMWWLLNQVSHVLRRARDKELRQYGVSNIEVAVLFTIQATGNSTMISEISRWMTREPHSTSELVERMGKKGLVRKARDPDKQNQVRVYLTEKGKQVYDQAIKTGLIEDMLSCITEEQRHQFITSLEALRYNALTKLEMDTEVPFPQYTD